MVFLSGLTPVTSARTVVFGIVAIGLPLGISAQTAPHAKRHAFDFPAEMPVDAHFERDICADQLSIGDTVSAAVLPARFRDYSGDPWPKQFLVVLKRRTLAATERGMRFTAISADIDGTRIAHVVGLFSPDIEGSHRERGNMEVDCYVKGAELNGILTRRLRVPAHGAVRSGDSTSVRPRGQRSTSHR